VKPIVKRETFIGGIKKGGESKMGGEKTKWETEG
jgi:hypothetical protein